MREVPQKAGFHRMESAFADCFSALHGDKTIRGSGGLMGLSEAVEGQRRQVTVLFADIVGFTNIAETLGEEGAFDLVRDLTTNMTTIVSAERGTVQEFRGDGIMALFGSPIALEDAPLRACRTALKLQHMLRDIAPRLQARYGFSPQVRIGIHAGPVIMGEVDDQRQMRMTAIGDTVNIAARLQVEAAPGESLISEVVAGQVAGQVELTGMGERAIRGKSQPMQILRLDGLIASASRFDAARRQGLTSLVEREPELARLEAQLDRARGGRIEFVNIVGDAGIGKSRLMYEFRRQHEKDGLLILAGDCMADGVSSAFLPFVELVRTSFGIRKSDTAETTDRKLRAGLQQIGFDIDASVPYLMTLLGQKDSSGLLAGLSADLIGVRMRQLLKDLLWHSCRDRPVILFVEDLHWIDPGSEQLLQRIAAAADAAADAVPLLVVCAFRPYYAPPWAERANVIRLALGPLTNDGTVQLLSEKLGVSDLGAELVRLAVEKIEGNPLYAEEIAKFLKSRRSDLPDQGPSPPGIVLPANLQNLIMERFDQLDEQTRSVLHAASVAGRRFKSDLIADVMGRTVPVELCLAEAEQLEILHRVTGPDADFIFNHALVQDAVYATLMTAQKRSLHGRVGLALEARFSGREADIADTLANHFTQTDLFEKAITYLTIAGQKNLRIFSLEVADSYFVQAVEMMDRHGIDIGAEFSAQLLSDWLEVQQWRADFDRSIRIFEPRLTQIEDLSGTRRYAQILALLGVAYVQQYRYREADILLEKALQAGEERNEQAAIAHALLGLMVIECVRPRNGSFAIVKSIYDRLDAMAFEKDQLYFQTFARFYLSWSMMIRGDLDPSLALGLGTIEIGHRENYPGAIGFGSTAAAYIECICENFDRSIAYAEDGVRLAGGIVDKLICLSMKGLSLTLGGRAAEGLDLLLDVRRQLEEMRYLSLFNIVDMPIGLALASVGDLEKGLSWLDRAALDHLDHKNPHGACVTNFVAGEIYRQMASGKEKPSADLLRRNFWFLIRRLPFARRHALRHYDQAISIGRQAALHGVTAQAMLGKARIQRLARQPDAAQQTLAAARDELSHVSWSWLEHQIAAEEASLRR
ncbi:adenylate/guanylate cyclase domain-containing protein [Tabrizicola sp.]|uniref:ATP-binding protein n=1 Tax=Tabrizicola sp. TaxID=2005166 RepID=UPI00262BC742|nr:adenylate/guanylate cyclase domain-containing protein [Tabrizicola sp.]MDM7932478.1 adenylate/guanylate cyclase domain-containing protein [Tabrizicola sp.]